MVQVSDPVLPDFFGKSREEEGITLHFKLNDGRQTTCHPNAGENRLWHSPDGIDTKSRADIGDCGRAFRELAAPPTLPPLPTITPSGECGCPGVKYDGRCVDNDPHGGLGCSACGIPTCRYCDSNGIPDCPL